MSTMEALRQAAPPPRRGRPIVLSSDSEEDDIPIPVSARKIAQNAERTQPATLNETSKEADQTSSPSSGVMRPTDSQQVEAHRQVQVPRSTGSGVKGGEDLDLNFDRLGLKVDKPEPRSVDPRWSPKKPSSRPQQAGDATQRYKQTERPAGEQTSGGLSRTTKPRSDYRDHNGLKEHLEAFDRPTFSAGSQSQQPKPRSIPAISSESQPQPRPPTYHSSKSTPVPRPNTTATATHSADYAKFKSTGAFASPARPTASSSAFAVDPASPFYRLKKQELPQDSWMVIQMNAHHAQQRQNGRPSAPVGPTTYMGSEYGIAAGYAAKTAVSAGPSVKKPSNEDDGEDFSSALNAVQVDASDYNRVPADQAEADMRELLSGAIGDGEDNTGGAEEGAQLVEGFAEGMSLMPHQIRGVSWMGQREVGTKRGGILADDMGLGKTVQTIANILKRPRNKAEEKLGYSTTTLIVTPLSVMDQWVKEVKTKTAPGRLKVCSYHGPQRGKLADKLGKFDVVVTTYSTLSSEHGAPTKTTVGKAKAKAAASLLSDSESGSDSDGERFGKSLKKAKPKTSPLFQMKWLRVVCDEAQQIKNRNTKAAKAAVALDARLRWCLTGTPIQNNVEELFSLFQFLRAKPLDDWALFKERIIQPVKAGRTKYAMKRIHAVLKAIMLRRTKDATIDGKAILNLPARNVNVVSCEFDRAERDFYDALEKKQALTFNRFLKAGTAMSNYTSVLTLLLRMRQACCHPSLVTASISTDASALESKPAVDDNLDGDADELADLMQDVGLGKKSMKCEICLAPLIDSVATSCDDCQDFVRKAREGSDATPNMPPSSAKTRMTLEILKQIEERSDGQQKTIIFSQFTSFLNIVEPFLKQSGVKYVRYDGSMRADKREQALEAIRSKAEIKVILISFKAGSTGLNLTCCNNVILLDLWWNPALEDQAYDRAHRLGQKLDVHIYKLTVRGSVEDRILMLQDAKRELAKAALSGDSTKNMKLQLQDLMDLFKPGHGTRDDDDD